MKNLKNMLTIATSEIRSRMSLLAASIVIGFFPILFPTLGKSLGLASDYSDVGVIAYAILLCTALGYSLLTGASAIGSDLINRKMNFYFVRPLSSLTVWGGKILGSLALVFGGGLIVLAPSLIFFTQSTKQFLTFSHMLTYGSLALFCLGLGLVAGVLFRSKSFLLGLDLGLIPVAIVLGGIAFVRIIVAYQGSYFLEQMGISSNFDPAAVIIAVIGVIMILSTGIGLNFGRTDIKKVHRALSAGLWGLVMAFVLSGLTFSQWVVSASPSDIVQLYGGYFAGGEKWVIVSGRAWGRGQYQATFLLNPKTDDYVRLESTRVEISKDGSKAVWIKQKGILTDEYQIVKMNLNDDVAKPVETKISFPREVNFEISQDGSRLLVTRDKLMTVFDLNNDKELATVHTPSNFKWLSSVAFLSPDLIRLYCSTEEVNGITPMHIFELEVNNKKLVEVGKFNLERYSYLWQVSQDGERVIAGSAIYNGKTGELIANLNDSKFDKRVQFLNDGKFASIEWRAGEANLKIFSENATEEKEIPLGKTAGAYIANQLSEDELILYSRQSSQDYRHWNIVSVNTKTGSVSVKAERLKPMDINYWGGRSAYSNRSKALKPYFISPKGLIRMDLSTGQEELIDILSVNETNVAEE